MSGCERRLGRAPIREKKGKEKKHREDRRKSAAGQTGTLALERDERSRSRREHRTRVRGAWRAELSKEELMPDDHEEADQEVARKLAESRARREVLMAKWVNRGEVGGPDADGSSSSGEISDTERPEAAVEKLDEKAQEQKRELARFILQHKLEHDDMFQENADEDALKGGHGQSAAISQTGASADDWDDGEGYYKAKIGEVMAGRYLVVEDMCGKGVFSNVVKAKDQEECGQMVAVKVMRCNDMMRKAAEKEVEVLERLNRADKGNKRHVIRLIRHFVYRGHLCLVFECMWDNLRVALKKYTKDKGMSLQAVRAYTKQLLIGLRHVHRCNIIHADIKPDNILISAGHNLVKICDLGSATELTDVEPTPYLVSRFYRAPEAILGKEYGPPVDIFAIGCTLYELFTGKILFPGRTNNDMLRLMMEFKGKIPHKMIKSGMLWKQHFDENLDFKYQDTDKATRKKITRVMTDLSSKRNIQDLVLNRVGPEKQKSTDADDQIYVKKAKQFADLIQQMTALDPDKRISAHDALSHVFIVEPGPGAKPTAKAKK